VSKFDEIREQEQARARRRPSALQVAWLTVILILGATIAWLALSEPEKPAPAVGKKDAGQSYGTKTLEDDRSLAVPTSADPPAPQPAVSDEMGADTTPQPVANQEPAEPSVGLHTMSDGSEEAPLNDAPDEPGLGLAADPALVEQSDIGPLPIVGSDGREPWQVYARPFDEFITRPRISIVISGLGLSSLITRTAIETLPGEVTLGFSIYGNNLESWIDEARGAGHEVILMVPMEPYEYPKHDPGPDTLRVDLKAEDNLARLRHVLSRATRYVGVTNDMGSKFTATEAAITPVLEELKARGLLFLDARTSQYSAAARIARELRLPRAINNRYLDNQPNEQEILSQLEQLENVARTYGAAVGVGRPYPVTIRTVKKWADGLEARGFVLAPLTAVANRQPVR